jgi:hypothetical protein
VDDSESEALVIFVYPQMHALHPPDSGCDIEREPILVQDIH